jgi:hypothetical protein
MKTTHTFLWLMLFLFPFGIAAQTVRFSQTKEGNTLNFVLSNSRIRQSIALKDSILFSDTLQSEKPWTSHFDRPAAVLVTDAGFKLHVVWNGWRAPGKDNNAANPVVFTQKNFRFSRYTVTDSAGGKQVNLFFKGTDNPFVLRLSYSLMPGKFYSRRQIALSDPKLHGHFLQRIDVRSGYAVFEEISPATKQTAGISIEGMHFAYTEQVKLKNSGGNSFHILKAGGFGQPAAFANANSGGFLGLEYPTGTTQIKNKKQGIFSVKSFQYFGHRIENRPIASNWEVTAVTPQPYVKKWFFTYVDDIRVAPAKPYILYNSWYDLRSEAYAKADKNIPKNAVMNDTNTLRIIRLLRKNMIEKHHIRLNAFVLDDGWDNYESAWALNRHEFPNGLRPLADTLAKTGTRLGIWYGPIGGYSFAMRRVKWMGEHGYEVTGHKYVYGSAQLCLAGKNYSVLFQKRTSDMVKNDHVGYFKWDGIQFSCSDPTHGHPVGIYSRRAVMQSVIAKCNAVRAIDPKVYLNITSGTWLSPWWLQYANQIWMDAADYAFADVPSISRRDNAMTYRDYALYDDFKVRDMWIPAANLMTHGIIKGRLENISKGGEPMDRFTNNAVLYFARGITMWELYISPDILTDAEWNVLAQAIHWAESVQDVMATTFMTGGNPAKGQTYGYVHFKGDKGLIAVRNPKIANDSIRIRLKPDYGLDEDAASLVVEQIYPYRRILPGLYSAGGTVEIPLKGFETALFNVYPLSSTNRPLLADAVFTLKTEGNRLQYNIFQAGPKIQFLNLQNTKDFDTRKLETLRRALPEGKTPHYNVAVKKGKKNVVLTLTPVPDNANRPASVALLLNHPQQGGKFPEITIRQGNKTLKVSKQFIKGKWAWYSAVPDSTKEKVILTIPAEQWHGQAALWVQNICYRQPDKLSVELKNPATREILPPLAWPTAEKRDYLMLKKIRF